MRALLALGLVALVACGASDGRRLSAASVSPSALRAGRAAQSVDDDLTVAGERDALPVFSTTTPRRASRGGARSPGARTHTPPAGADRGDIPAARSGGSSTAKASWYDRGCCTASGERFDPNALTFAARSRQWGRKIQFCHEGHCVTARQNDYGPAEWTGRTFDLSRAAFDAIAELGAGEIEVTWTVVS